MMKLFRVLLAIFSLFIVICLFTILCLAIFVDPNKLKPVIVQEVQKKTGYHLLIDGNLSWSFYPRLGVHVEQMTLSAPMQATPFIDLHNVKISASLRQFLQRKEKLLGTLHIDQATLAKLNAENIYIGLQWQNNVLTLDPISASLYSGTATGSANGSQLSTMPHWDFDVQFSQIQIEPLLKDINPNSKLRLSGAGQVRLKAQTYGKSRDEVLNNLVGTTAFALHNGILYGLDLNYLVQTADALINKQPVTSPVNIDRTVFNDVTGTAVMNKGVATINQFSLIAPAFTSNATGTIHLISREIDLQLKLNAQEILKTKWEIPVLITGNLSAPDVHLDTREIQKLYVKTELEKVKTKVKERIKDIPGKTGEFLQNLLGQ